MYLEGTWASVGWEWQRREEKRLLQEVARIASRSFTGFGNRHFLHKLTKKCYLMFFSFFETLISVDFH